MSSLSALPRLRPEVSLVPFCSSAREETYLVLLPDGRSLQATRRLYELMAHLDGSRDIEELARIFSDTWDFAVRPEDVQGWIDRYIVPHDLLEPVPGPPLSVPSGKTKSPSTKGVMLIPCKLAQPLTRRLCFLLRPLCALPLLWASTVCHALVYLGLRFDTPAGYFGSLPASACLSGYLLLLFSVLFHEFGHLSACTYFNCPHGEIRLGLYLVFPVFYANVSPAWRLRRKARVVVDLAGIYFQLVTTIPVCLLFLLTRDPLWALLLLELDAMVLFSLNPFLRFDGYWLCSDLLGVPNLRARSQLLIRDLWSRLIGRPSVQEAPLLRIRPPARLGLALYGIGTYGFGALVLVLLGGFLPSRLVMLPSEFARLLEVVITGWSQGNVPGALVGIVQLVFLCVMLLAGSRMLIQCVRTASRAGRNLLRRIAGFLRKEPPHG